ncbi:MAG: 5-formyltetrahydrofolate cyclo-ligase [Candidatus Dadabacteria bacterium]|nr:MAG: 5-formyltetrahydrofolate cyclo-ligase [Candidatus Dadabacteria bacterium]
MTGGTSTLPLSVEKQRLRELVAVRVRSLDSEARCRMEEAIAARIVALEAFRHAEQILSYAALRDEADVGQVAIEAAARGKRVFLPVVKDDGNLEFCRWEPGATLRRSSYGVLEPAGGERLGQAPALIIVPGRAFDRRGGRLGRGRGCYDRFLASPQGRLGPAVGVAFSCQLLDRVPQGPNDQSVDMVVAERGLLYAGHRW